MFEGYQDSLDGELATLEIKGRWHVGVDWTDSEGNYAGFEPIGYIYKHKSSAQRKIKQLLDSYWCY